MDPEQQEPQLNKGGRPTLAHRKELALNALREGLTKAAAAAKAGVSYDTFNRWQKKSAGFASEVELAILESRADLEKCAHKGGKDDPKIAIEILARRWPEDWGRKEKEGVDAAIQAAQGIVEIVKVLAGKQIAVPASGDVTNEDGDDSHSVDEKEPSSVPDGSAVGGEADA